MAGDCGGSPRRYVARNTRRLPTTTRTAAMPIVRAASGVIDEVMIATLAARVIAMSAVNTTKASALRSRIPVLERVR
jgi:hypothetical protein